MAEGTLKKAIDKGFGLLQCYDDSASGQRLMTVSDCFYSVSS